ncbi:DUF2460 domain-containing protein [Pseudomonas nitroreducens]|uniref:DUF2460 domain-containing protein n=1 Tax=Pseudomonas nitroreducens TaxID=46680 RepID=UPI00265A414D|nr:DUF2460 domain-containing protein [Pseudomonas nitroreducens]MCP1647001.1 uncharacterized protein (TIGR02217 family) [Pseudomonas nitroreducens]MCP1685577.1 uncharacterized protein (TIGR02217 family) [Pseudomonas nitroreducens]
MGEFIEERLDSCIRLGAETEDGFFLDVTRTASGARYAALKNGKPWRTFDIEYVKDDKDLALQVTSLYYRTWGGYAGFRVQAWDDFTTALDGVSAYTSRDSVLDVVSPGVYQLVKEYGTDKPALPSIGRPRRTIFKPVQGAVAIAVAQLDYPNGYTVDVTNGRVTLAANKTGVITGITKGSSTVISALNSFVVGESVVFKDIQGTVQLNGRRARVTARSATSITVAINSSTFGDYISGGTVQTRPLDAGTDIVTGGCQFDYPVVFSSRFNVQALGMDIGQASGLTLEELLNP